MNKVTVFAFIICSVLEIYEKTVYNVFIAMRIKGV